LECQLSLADGAFFCYTKHEPVGVCGQIIPVRRYNKHINYLFLFVMYSMRSLAWHS